MEIEATWEVKVKSGITTIDLTDLGLTEKKWNKMSDAEKRNRINAELLETDHYMTVPEVTEFEII